MIYMVLETLIGSAVGYLVSSIKKSKGGKQAGDELSTAIWEWVRPLFLKDDEPLTDLKDAPDDQDNQQRVALKIKTHIKKNPDAEGELKAILEKLQAEGEEPAQIKITQTHYSSGDNIGRDKIVNK